MVGLNATLAAMAFLTPFHFVSQHNPELKIYDLVPPAKPPGMVPTKATKAAAKAKALSGDPSALHLRRRLTHPESGSGSGDYAVNSCSWACDGDCDDGSPGSEYGICTTGTDCYDCGTCEMDMCAYSGGTSDSCTWACDGMCDSFLCAEGTDCTDCGTCNTQSPSPPLMEMSHPYSLHMKYTLREAAAAALSCGWGSDSSTCSVYDNNDDWGDDDFGDPTDVRPRPSLRHHNMPVPSLPIVTYPLPPITRLPAPITPLPSPPEQSSAPAP